MIINKWSFRGGILMTVNILFLTIMFKKREISIEEAIHQEVVEKMYENTKVQRISMYDYI